MRHLDGKVPVSFTTLNARPEGRPRPVAEAERARANALLDRRAVEQRAGEAGSTRPFGPLDLRADRGAYTEQLTVDLPGADFFTVAKGAFEQFSLTLYCAQPGAYDLTISLPVRYRSTEARIRLQPQRVICPERLEAWMLIRDLAAPQASPPDVMRIGTFVFRDGAFEPAP